LQLIANIVVLTAIYALISCGYVLIYRVSRVLNLAHGELMMVGAYLLVATAGLVPANPAVAIALAAVLSVLVGLAIYYVLMRRMTGNSILAAVLTTIALGILIRGLVILIWSAQHQHPAEALRLGNPSIEILGARISLISATLIAVTALVYGALFFFLHWSRWGIRMRAVGQDPLLASQRGIDLHIVFALAWAIATFTGSMAGMLMAMDSGLDATMVMIGLKAFPAALVGGLDSLAGALIGSLIISLSENLMITFVNPLLADVIPFVILLLMLMVRPWGLFGTKEELDRV
jgi:branched-chain amino acid transport system permease protein